MVKTIELLWDLISHDPKEKEVSKSAGGLYQIYGTHPIYGRDVLLYIGKSTKNLDKRIEVHNNTWIKYEYDPVKVYHGIVVSKSRRSKFSAKEAIDRAESLLIYYCAPAYNSNSLAGIAKKYLRGDVILRNYGRIGSLPIEVSTNWYNSAVWKDNFFTR